MKILMASVEPEDAKLGRDIGAHGIITNPSVLAAAGAIWREKLGKAAEILPGPIHLQLTEESEDSMIKQAVEFREIAGERLVVKICITRTGLAVMRELQHRGLAVDITAIVTLNQAAVAAQAGADYLAVYMGRVDRFGEDGSALIGEIRRYLDLHGFAARIVAASVQNRLHFKNASLFGAHYAACPPGLVSSLISHPVTDQSISSFKEEWERM